MILCYLVHISTTEYLLCKVCGIQGTQVHKNKITYSMKNISVNHIRVFNKVTMVHTVSSKCFSSVGEPFIILTEHLPIYVFGLMDLPSWTEEINPEQTSPSLNDMNQHKQSRYYSYWTFISCIYASAVRKHSLWNK